ncbi:MAG: hypothetical protein JW727_06325 [Candidatus Aenigmarchaeota archaeon]|nr:hypothetical protein [Candidatus Aenigmarchaeota archaeon]
MGFLSSVLCMFNSEGAFRRRISRLRKKWDRLREKVDKKGYASKKDLLQKLDVAEQKIRTLEEEEGMNRWAKKDMAAKVEIELEKIVEEIKTEEAKVKENEGVEKLEGKLKEYEK